MIYYGFCGALKRMSGLKNDAFYEIFNTKYENLDRQFRNYKNNNNYNPSCVEFEEAIHETPVLISGPRRRRLVTSSLSTSNSSCIFLIATGVCT